MSLGSITEALRFLSILCATIAAVALPARAQHAEGAPEREVGILHVQGNVYMVVGSGGNMTVQAGKDGILIVDTQLADISEDIFKRITPLSDRPIQYIVNTHAHPAHTGGNASFAELGAAVFGGNVTGVVNRSVLGQSAKIIAHENVLSAMSSADPAPPFEAWPTDVFYTSKKELFFNGEGVQIFHQPAAHTDGDSIVYFRRSDVISTGDIFVSNSYPVINRDEGGTVKGIINGLNRILDLALPALMQEGGTMIVPGHGRLCDEADVLEYRDMVVIVRDRVQSMIDRGMSLPETQAARPTLGYDGQYGTNDDWTAADFVAAIYADLTSNAAASDESDRQ